MGISSAPLLANPFLMMHEYKFMEKLEEDNIYQAWQINFTSRYIDDLISLNNPTFHTFILAIYPQELQIKQLENTTNVIASYLELQYTIQDEQFHTSLYDKCDSFIFNVVNYPFVEQSNIPDTPAYGVYTSHLVCIARVCDSYKDFKFHHNNLCLKLYYQGFKYRKLCKHLKKTNIDLLFAKYDVWPEVPLPVLASKPRHVTLHS